MTGPERRPTVTVDVGGVRVGSARPVVVQSMTNTDTADVPGTVAQVNALHGAGSELVRVTVNTEAAARAIPEIVKQVAVPVIGDFHYNGHVLLTKYPGCARALAKYRINPGNVGGKHHDDNFRAIVQVAVDQGKPVRIGVNWGSLDQNLLTQMMDANAKSAEPLAARDVTMNAMVESAIQSAELAEQTGLAHDRIILSAKVSGVQDLVDVYRKLAPRSDYPLHLGLTEAGMGAKGIVASTAGLAILLQEGIGDTIRVSLTPKPNGDRTEEVKVAVMGCVVNGPGESKHADIGISLPGTFEEPKAPVYIDGRLSVTLKGDAIVSEFLAILEDYVARKYPAVASPVGH